MAAFVQKLVQRLGVASDEWCNSWVVKDDLGNEIVVECVAFVQSSFDAAKDCSNIFASQECQDIIEKIDVRFVRELSQRVLWQMLQAIKLPDGTYAINRNNVFGGGASGRCWWCLMCVDSSQAL